jgi:hypothetical protein
MKFRNTQLYDDGIFARARRVRVQNFGYDKL